MACLTLIGVPSSTPQRGPETAYPITILKTTPYRARDGYRAFYSHKHKSLGGNYLRAVGSYDNF